MFYRHGMECIFNMGVFMLEFLSTTTLHVSHKLLAGYWVTQGSSFWTGKDFTAALNRQPSDRDLVDCGQQAISLKYNQGLKDVKAYRFIYFCELHSNISYY